jgi:hypothetical protein
MPGSIKYWTFLEQLRNYSIINFSRRMDSCFRSTCIWNLTWPVFWKMTDCIKVWYLIQSIGDLFLRSRTFYLKKFSLWWIFNEMKETHDSTHCPGSSPVSFPTDLNVYIMSIEDHWGMQNHKKAFGKTGVYSITHALCCHPLKWSYTTSGLTISFWVPLESLLDCFWRTDGCLWTNWSLFI